MTGKGSIVALLFIEAQPADRGISLSLKSNPNSSKLPSGDGGAPTLFRITRQVAAHRVSAGMVSFYVKRLRVVYGVLDEKDKCLDSALTLLSEDHPRVSEGLGAFDGVFCPRGAIPKPFL